MNWSQVAWCFKVLWHLNKSYEFDGVEATMPDSRFWEALCDCY